MNTSDLTKVCDADPVLKRLFGGVFARDQLPIKHVARPFALIVNTHPITDVSAINSSMILIAHN